MEAELSAMGDKFETWIEESKNNKNSISTDHKIISKRTTVRGGSVNSRLYTA